MRTTADLADAVRFARAQGLEISTRGGGHNVAGKGVTDGGMMIDLASIAAVMLTQPNGGRAFSTDQTGIGSSR